MSNKTIKIRSREGGEFDCYISTPTSDHKVPAVVLASAIHGVDNDIRELAEEFAEQGYIAAAPDLFWRSLAGPLPHEDSRAVERSQPRLEKVRAGEADVRDTLAHIHSLPQSNRRAAVVGFCFGGPYAILGPKRLGYDAGIACHGTQLLDIIQKLNGVSAPICMIWGDQDYVAPVEVLTAYLGVSERMPNVEIHIIPGALHGYMMRRNTKAFNPETREFSMRRARDPGRTAPFGPGAGVAREMTAPGPQLLVRDVR